MYLYIHVAIDFYIDVSTYLCAGMHFAFDGNAANRAHALAHKYARLPLSAYPERHLRGGVRPFRRL
jgi:hypothetical protein